MPQQISSLLTPWFLLALVLFLLVQAEKWIHSHLYGVGWLLTNEKRSATVLYYLILAPGVFAHEFTQWLVAGALGVPTKRVMAWPEAQENGTLRLNFVQIVPTGRIRSAIIGAVPMITGIAIIWLISNQILDMEAFRSALSKGEVKQIGPALHDMGRASDFYLWMYLMFAVGNAMMPTPADRKGWPLILATFGGIIVFLTVIGTGEVLLDTYKNTILSGVRLVTTAFATVLGLEICAILLVGLIEEILERTTKRKFDYHPQQTKTVIEREPGSNMPLPPGALLPSIYNLELPLPSSSKYGALAAKVRKPSPAFGGTAERPTTSSTSFQRPAGSPFGAPSKPVDEDKVPEKPTLSPRPTTEHSFQRPSSSFGALPRKPADTDEEGEEKEAEKQASLGPRQSTGPGFQRPASPFAAPPQKPADADEDDEKEAEKPALGPRQSTGPGFQRPASPFGTPPRKPADADEDDEKEAGKPVLGPRQSTGPGFQRPASPFAAPPRKPADEGDEKEAEKPALGPRQSTGPGFQRPASPFRASGKPISTFLDDDETEEDDEDDLDNGDELEYVDIDDV